MKNLLITLLLLISSLTLWAQSEETWHCQTDEIYLEILRNNPDAVRERAKLQEFVSNFIANAPKSEDTYIIPIVFHVVHYYGQENISYEQIEEAVEFMNNDFNRLRSDTANIVEEFKSIAANSKIEFRLARIDPDGNCTVGVTRTVSETTYGGGEDAKDAAPTWPPNMYLNIWVVNSLPNGAAGWAYYPGTAPYGSDGVILLHDYVGSTGTSSYTRGSTLTHEVGHYLNLGHPWGHTNDPGLASNCDIDDDIDDTPNTIGHSSCSLTAVTCGSLDNVQNFMEYSYCTKMFTIGQAEMMRAVLNSSTAGRNNLISQQNLIATGTNDGYEPQLCPPVADFAGNKRIGCEGFTVQYNELTYGTDYVEAYDWSFEGGEPAISSESSPIVNYDTKGVYSVEFTAINPSDSDTKLVDEYIRVYDVQDGYTIPYTESFESTTFPKITGNSDNDFYIDARGSETWEQNNFGDEGKSVRIINKRNNVGTLNKIFLPNLLVTEFDKPIYVSLKAAYGKSGDLSGDRLKFYVSNSCGDTLRIVHIINSTQLISTYSSSFSTYLPLSSHWKTHSFTINPSQIRGENLRLVIEAEAGGGNTLYVDEVSFSYTSDINLAQSSNLISAYPNPTDGSLFIENQLSNGDYAITIFDTMGRLVFETSTSNKTYDASGILADKPAGLYLIKILTEEGAKVIKVNKSK